MSNYTDSSGKELNREATLPITRYDEEGDLINEDGVEVDIILEDENEKCTFISFDVLSEYNLKKFKTLTRALFEDKCEIVALTDLDWVKTEENKEEK